KPFLLLFTSIHWFSLGSARHLVSFILTTVPVRTAAASGGSAIPIAPSRIRHRPEETKLLQLGAFIYTNRSRMAAGGAKGERIAAREHYHDAYIFRRVTGTTYILMAVTGLGYLALMWSTGVLLGGFVTVLQKKDFWCITVISLTQAARIFNDLAEQLAPNFVSMLAGNIAVGLVDLRERIPDVARALWRRPAAASTWHMLS
ncbi:unnamed protein product, partial [Urochloa humidicola]